MRKVSIIDNKTIDPSGNMHKLGYLVEEHVPFNKRAYEAKGCRAIANVIDYDGKKEVNPNAWTEISLTELTTNVKGVVSSRSITITLDGANRQALIDLLTR